MSKSEKLVREPVCKLSNLYFLLFPTPLFTRIPRVSFRFYFQILNPNYEKFNIKPALNHHFHHSKQWQWIGTIIPKNGQDVPVLQSPFRQSHVSSNLLRVFPKYRQRSLFHVQIRLSIPLRLFHSIFLTHKHCCGRPRPQNSGSGSVLRASLVQGILHRQGMFLLFYTLTKEPSDPKLASLSE